MTVFVFEVEADLPGGAEWWVGEEAATRGADAEAGVVGVGDVARGEDTSLLEGAS